MTTISSFVESLPLASLCGQLLVVGVEGVLPPPALRTALAQGHVGGAIVFRRNVGPMPLDVAKLTEALKTAAPAELPPLIAERML